MARSPWLNGSDAPHHLLKSQIASALYDEATFPNKLSGISCLNKLLYAILEKETPGERQAVGPTIVRARGLGTQIAPARRAHDKIRSTSG